MPVRLASGEEYHVWLATAAWHHPCVLVHEQRSNFRVPPAGWSHREPASRARAAKGAAGAGSQ